jgi:hypothetical protein
MTTAEKNSIDFRLPHSPDTGLVKSRAHARSERVNEINAIMATISRWDSNFVVLKPPLPGGDFEFGTWLTPERVDEFYAMSLQRQDTVEQFPVNEINAPWFQFNEALGNLLYHSDGEMHQVHVAVLFPVWTDGILGEIAWMAPKWASTPFEAAQRVTLSRQLDAFDDAVRAGDVDAQAAIFGDNLRGVVRIAEVDGDHRYRGIANTPDELKSAWAAPEVGRVLELERVHQIISNWYVFASYRSLVEVSGRNVVRETARLLPVGPDGKFIGELSYSMETRG